jgi:DNA repair protein RecN (Recombination protein N)
LIVVLHELRVADLGIIEELAVIFGPGLTVITGETGAGKTLVVEALELLGGARSDPSLVRAGASEARVEGRFETAGGGEMVLARVIPRDGRSRAYIDGRLATAAELADAATELIDLHGQHAHRTLLGPAAQRAALDAFAGKRALEPLTMYRAARAEIREVDRALDKLGGDPKARAREIALLEYQVGEIDAALITDDEEDRSLDFEESLLGDAVSTREALAAAYAEVEGAAVDAVGRAAAALGGRIAATELEQRLLAVQAELTELARDLRDTGEQVVDDPERLETIRLRRKVLLDLRRKYGDTIDDVRTYRDESAARLARLHSYDERVEQLLAARAQAERRAARAASSLHEARVMAAVDLAPQLNDRLVRLAMPSARFEVQVHPTGPSDDGADDVIFMLAANMGEHLQPLQRVASGGELSRTMLALRTALSERDETARAAVLVFDEVDAGIGGEAGGAVGRELATLADDAQVLCVTHLAQVAACADAQIVVSKTERDGRTSAAAELVLDEARVGELSRMLAGVGESTHAQEHARELLAGAQTFTGGTR